MPSAKSMLLVFAHIILTSNNYYLNKRLLQKISEIYLNGGEQTANHFSVRNKKRKRESCVVSCGVQLQFMVVTFTFLFTDTGLIIVLMNSIGRQVKWNPTNRNRAHDVQESKYFAFNHYTFLRCEQFLWKKICTVAEKKHCEMHACESRTKKMKRSTFPWLIV